MTSDKNSTTSSSNNPLEQFVLLAKTAKGAAAMELIRQVLSAHGVYVFGELLDMPNIKELENGPNINYYRTLLLFAYGTYREYIENKDQLLELNEAEKRKLKHLTIVTLATKMNCIPYSVLLQEIDMKNVRDLEDLIIEAIYADIIHGKLDQKNSQLEVDYTIGRDTQSNVLGSIVGTLQEWCDSCEAVLKSVEKQIHRANIEKNQALKHKDVIEAEVADIKKTLKAQSQESDDVMDSRRLDQETREAMTQGGDKKKGVKGKGVRGSGKFWQSK